MGIKKLTLLHLFVAISFIAMAQKGTIRGLVTDVKTKEPLVGATVMLEGTTTGTTTDFDGRYEIGKITPGAYKIRCSFISYETSFIENVKIQANKTIELNFKLNESNVEIGDVKVVAQANRRSENILLLEQKNAIAAIQSIGAQEISRKGVSDAEGAVTKISGVSKQEGVKNVFVRGLGDRFNYTSFNGFPVPSEDPEYKNISLDFFSSDMIESVGVNKVFGAQMDGDAGGAVINISSKKLVKDSEFSVDASAGINTKTVSEDFLKLDGGNTFGYANKDGGPSDLTQYKFHNSLDPDKQNFQMNQDYAIAGGKKLLIGPNQNSFRFYLLGTYSSDYSYIEGVTRNTTTTGDIFQDQTLNEYTQNFSHMVMTDVDYRFKDHELTYNGLYIHTNTQSMEDYFGKNSEIFQDVEKYGSKGLLRRQQTNDNSLLVNQLMWNWKLSDLLSLHAGASYNHIKGNEPDRRMNYLSNYEEDILSPTKGTGRQERYFSEVKEDDVNPKVGISYRLTKDPDNKSVLNIGYDGRIIDRSFEAIEYDHGITAVNLPELNRDDFSLDEVFNQEGLNNDIFDQNKNKDKYSVDKYVHSGYGEVVYEFNQKFTGSAGIRADKVNMKVKSSLNNGGKPDETEIDEFYFLPSINLKYDLTDKNSFRLGLSRTYTLPQDKEISPFRYVGPVWKSQGNPDIQPAVNYNVDLKWDYYLSPDELFSLTGLFKYVKDPISRVEKASAGGYLTYDNISDHATIFGVEMEVRKNIFKTVTENGKNNKLSTGINASYIYTDVKLEDKNDIDFTNHWSKLEGAAPGIINADLSYSMSKNDFSLTSSLVMNYFSKRIYTIGAQGYQDIKEEGLTALDFVSSAKLNKHWGLNLKAKNLLNPNFRLKRESSGEDEDVGSIILSDYKKGISFSLGISYDL